MVRDLKRSRQLKASQQASSLFTATDGTKIEISVFGGNFRGPCPLEAAEQVTVINYIRKKCPNVLHPRNEGKRNRNQIELEKAEGLIAGASDVIIPGSPSFVCELKRKDRTKSTVSKVQIDFLKWCKELGCFVCVAYGHKAALEAFNDWYRLARKET